MELHIAKTIHNFYNHDSIIEIRKQNFIEEKFN